MKSKVDPDNIYPTNHLREAMASRDVTWAEIVEVVQKPEVSFGPDMQGRFVLQKGDLSVVVADRDGAVLTVLLRSETQWSNEDARSRKRKK